MRGLRALLAGAVALLLLLAGCTQEPESPTYPPPPTDNNLPPSLFVFPGAIDGLTVNLFLSASDPEGSSVSCAVYFGDGKSTTVPCTGGTKLSHTYPRTGSYEIQILAEDPQGAVTARTLAITLPPPTRPDCPPPIPLAAAQSKDLPELTGWHEVEEAARVEGLVLVRPLASELVLPAGTEALGAPREGWMLLKTSPGKERLVAEELLSRGLITYAQPVYRYQPLLVPNDFYFDRYQRSHFDMMSLTNGWDYLSYKACRPKVAVIDTGADIGHEDLARNLLAGYDFADNDPDPSDFDGHGTMVSGIVSAVTDNVIGVAGSTNNLAWVVPLKVFTDAGSGDSVAIAEAIDHARSNGYHVLNMSLCLLNRAGTACAAAADPYIEDALKNAYDAGLIALAASGNYADSYVGYPANSIYTIAVGSVSLDGVRSEFSNYGDALDFVAPGEGVLSTAPEDQYHSGDGTSFATPFVSGMVALYLGQYYALKGSLPSFGQAYTCLANNTNQGSWNPETGYGVPQANEVLDPFDGACYP